MAPAGPAYLIIPKDIGDWLARWAAVAPHREPQSNMLLWNLLFGGGVRSIVKIADPARPQKSLPSLSPPLWAFLAEPPRGGSPGRMALPISTSRGLTLPIGCDPTKSKSTRPLLHSKFHSQKSAKLPGCCPRTCCGVSHGAHPRWLGQAAAKDIADGTAVCRVLNFYGKDNNQALPFRLASQWGMMSS